MTKPGTIQGREEFLSRISSKLGRESQLTTAPVHETRGVPDFHRDKSFTADEKLLGFTENWSKLNGKFRLVSKANAAAEIATYLLEVIEEHQVSNVSRWQEFKLDNLQLDKPLDDAGIAVVPWGELDEHDDRVPQASTFPDDSKWAKREPLMRAVERCTLGVVWPDFAIANTGTLAIIGTPDHPRSVSLLSSILFAVIRKDQIVTRMGEVWHHVDEKYTKSDREMPASLTLITGPSRSADIENDLTIGIHGPGKVYTVIIDDE